MRRSKKILLLVLLAVSVAVGISGCVHRSGELYCDTRFSAQGTTVLVKGVRWWDGGPKRDIVSTSIGTFFILRLALFSWWWDTVCLPYDIYLRTDGIDFIVRDEMGRPVPGTLLTGYGEYSQCGLHKKTDSGGRVYFPRREYRMSWLQVTKDGYYKSCRHEPFAIGTNKLVNLMVKRIRNPVRLVHHTMEYKPYPATNEVLKLDLETLDWCPPYGRGKHDDLHLVFDGWRDPKEWFNFRGRLSISMPNCVDGFYRLKLDAESDFPYAYEANTNANFEKSFEFRHVCTPKGIGESRRFADDEYLIYRVRTQTNELGQVTHAHYGRIGEKLRQFIGLSMKNWYNAKENDPNLEDARLR